MICTTCKTSNREIAKYCKQCGVKLHLSQSKLDSLIGLDDIKKVISDLTLVMEAVKNDGLTYSDRLHTILIGNAGVGKTKLVYELAALYYQYGITKDDTPIILDAVDFNDFISNFSDSFKKAKGKVLCIENVQKLIPAGYSHSVEQLDKIFKEMSKPEYRLDPIIILSGQPQGFREYLNLNDGIKSKFRFIFNVPDFDSNQLCQYTENELSKYGFNISEPAREKLKGVYKFNLKQNRMPDRDCDAQNAWLALKLSEDIKSNYYIRNSTSGSGNKTIVPEDIKGAFESEKSLEQILSEVDLLVGMSGIKLAIRNLIDEINIQKRRAVQGIGKEQSIAFHVVLTGNPGTGKTTVARKLGEIFKAIGVLDLGHVVEVDRSKVVAQYVGQTAPLVNKLCDDAMGGILFIDEAYTLKQGDNDSFGQEAIDTLLKRMEDSRGKFIVVIAGYSNEIKSFLNSNPGLLSRFDKRYHFILDDYTATELFDIFRKIAEYESYLLDSDAIQKIEQEFVSICRNKSKSFGNGREARNLFEACRSLQSKRLSNLLVQPEYDQQELKFIRAEDIPSVECKKTKGVAEIFNDLDKLVGLDNVKHEVRNLISYLQVDKARAEQGGIQSNLNIHFVFRGNPGTGKTTVARMLADVFKSLELLPNGHLVEVDRSGLVGQYLGQTAPKVNAAVDSSMGGVLFIDEAYTLSSDMYGKEAIDTLLKRMEDDKGKFIVIAAGYYKEMESFLNSNSGLTSRFTKFIDFEDYTTEQMKSIFLGMVKSKGMTLEADANSTLTEMFEDIYCNRDKNFANGRTVRNIFEKSLQRQSARISPAVLLGKVSNEWLNLITVDDIACKAGII